MCLLNHNKTKQRKKKCANPEKPVLTDRLMKRWANELKELNSQDALPKAEVQ